MPSRFSTLRSSAATRRLLLAAAAATPLAGLPAPADEAAGVSRAELVDRWDLDGNGTIDASEASIARSRMRRSRLELETQSAIDPLTGRPRGVDDESAASAPEPTAEPSAPPRHRTPNDPSLPGNQVPGPQDPAPPQEPGAPSFPGAGRDRGIRRPPAAEPTTASPRGGALTGGIRAGAPAARPGYGAATPFSDLNAGRSRVASGVMPDPTSRSMRGRMTGGLVPRPLPVAPRGGAARSGSGTGRQAGGAPPAPVPTLPSIPRVTAEDIGGS